MNVRIDTIKASELEEHETVRVRSIKYTAKRRLLLCLLDGRVVWCNNKRLMVFVDNNIVGNSMLEHVGDVYYHMACDWILSFDVAHITRRSNGAYDIELNDVILHPSLRNTRSIQQPEDLASNFAEMSIIGQKIPSNVDMACLEKEIGIIHPGVPMRSARPLMTLVEKTTRFYLVDAIKRQTYYNKTKYMFKINGQNYLSNIHLDAELQDRFDNIVAKKSKFYLYYIDYNYCTRAYEPLFGVVEA